VRVEALVWVSALLLGGAASFVAGSAFAGRYASVVFPLFVLVVAYGITVFTDVRVRVILLAVVVAVGLASGSRNVFDNRTQAGQVADVIRARAKPGDVVLYCPDQLGPSVSRLLTGTHGLEQLTFPRGDRPELLDWVDYKERRAKVAPEAFARRVADRAGSDHTIWYVIAVQYRGGNEGRCDAVQHALTGLRTSPPLLIVPNDKYFEFLGLLEYPGR
jgi:uncharacterized membrane protein